MFTNIAFAEKSIISVIATYNTSSLQVEDTGATNTFYGIETKTYGNFGYGVLVEYPLSSKWGFESGIIYQPRGYKYETTFPNAGSDTINWMNLYIPFVGRFHPTKNFTGFIGGYTAQGFGKVTHKTTSEFGSNSTSTFKESGLKTADVGITYGAGLNFDLNSSSEMIIEIRWTEGLTNVIDTTISTGTDNTKGTIHEYSFVVGFRI